MAARPEGEPEVGPGTGPETGPGGGPRTGPRTGLARRRWLGRLAATAGGLAAAGGLPGPGMPAAHAQAGLSRYRGDEDPLSYAPRAALLERDPARFEGKVVMYDVEKSGVGYLLATHTAAHLPEFNALLAAIGRCRPRLVLTAEAMLRAVDNGDALIAWNVLGDYALARAARSPSLGVAFPSDFTLVLPRVMFISRHAEHPNAARLWVDYLLSRRGQEVLANRSRLHSVRDDVQGDRSAAALRAQLGPSMKPIDFDRTLAQALAPARYAAFIGDWRRAMGRPLRR